MKHRASVHISYELLKRALDIPEDVNLVMVISRDNFKLNETVQLVFEHPNFPASPEASFPVPYDDLNQVIRTAKGES